MRKVKIYLAVSLDGYVAQKDGGVSFLQGDGSDADSMGGYFDFYENVGDVIMGYNTYHQVVTELAVGNYPYKGKKSYVLTRKNIENEEEIFFVNKSVAELLGELKSNGDEGDIWINGGASIVNQVLKADMADEITISVIPTILGGGIRLFEENENEIKLRLKSTTNYNGIVDLVYEKR